MITLPLESLVENLPTGYGDTKDTNESNLPVVKVSNVSGSGHFHKQFEIRSFSKEKADELIVIEDDLLVVKSSGSKANILSGKTAICTKELSGKIIASNFLLKLRPDQGVISPKLLWYYLNSPYSKKYVKSIVGATTYPNLKWNLYGKHPIPSIPLDKQKWIVDILDTADELRQKDRALIAKYDELTQSLFLEMFGDANKARSKWVESSIKSLADSTKGAMRTGPFGSDLLHSEFVDEGISVLGIDNVVDNQFKWKGRRYITALKYEKLRRYTVFPRDVLISIMGTVGRVAIVPNDIGVAINTKHLAALTLNERIVNSAFIASSLQKDPYILDQLSRAGRGAIMTGLNLTIIKNLRLKLPPLELQNQYAEYAREIESQITTAQNSLSKSEFLFASLLQKAFKGELTN
ncbi:MAG: restriction endonuclease subunit S [Candidatus Marinimicrobia bacterium]|jgi:type I restriction enzyme, S subunit|nr:restriction endonuclease subunit S [Candidatus Neomarinimicrobiota bacterium]